MRVSQIVTNVLSDYISMGQKFQSANIVMKDISIIRQLIIAQKPLYKSPLPQDAQEDVSLVHTNHKFLTAPLVSQATP